MIKKTNKKTFNIVFGGVFVLVIISLLFNYLLNDYGIPNKEVFENKTVEFFKINGTMGNPNKDYMKSEFYTESVSSFMGKKEVACFTLSNNHVLHSKTENFKNCVLNKGDYYKNELLQFGMIDYNTDKVTVKKVKKQDYGKVISVTSDLELSQYFTALKGTDSSSTGELYQVKKTLKVKDVVLDFRFDEDLKDWKVYSSPNLDEKTKQFMSTWDFSKPIIDTKHLEIESSREYKPHNDTGDD